MPENVNSKPMPASRESFSLLTVDRAVSELRRGRMVTIRGSGGTAALVAAAEAATPAMLDEMAELSHVKPELAITARRGTVLNLRTETANVLILKPAQAFSAESIRDLADPISDTETIPENLSQVPAAAFSSEC
ncbi:MAG: hypothetical protein V3R66_06095, partial [Rhodospirillales bacterium]